MLALKFFNAKNDDLNPLGLFPEACFYKVSLFPVDAR